MPIISLNITCRLIFVKLTGHILYEAGMEILYIFWFGVSQWVYHKRWLSVPWDLEWKNNCIKFNMQFRMFKWQADGVPYTHALMPISRTVLRNGIGV